MMVERHDEETIDVEVGEEAGRSVVTLRGELDLLAAPRVRGRLLEVIGAGPGDLCVDVAGLRYLDSTGVGVLIAAARRVDADGHRLVLRNPGPELHRILAVGGLLEFFGLPDRPVVGPGRTGGEGIGPVR